MPIIYICHCRLSDLGVSEANLPVTERINKAIVLDGDTGTPVDTA